MTLDAKHILKAAHFPLAPSANRYWRSMPCVRKGMHYPFMVSSYGAMLKMIGAITFPSDDAKTYIQSIKEIALQNRWHTKTTASLRMTIVVCPRDRRAVDAHNYPKVLLDAMQAAGMFADDSQVKDLRVSLGPIIKGGAMIVNMWELTETDAMRYECALAGDL